MLNKRGISLLLWWLAVLYALFCVCHPFLIGCDCRDIGPEHTCGIVQYYASIGTVAWMVLLPLGMTLFRRRENMIIFLLILAFIPLVCTLFLLFAPALGLMTGDLFAMTVPEFGITLILTIPLVPYIGLLPLLGTGADTNTLYVLIFLYSLAAAVYGIYRYRNRET
ncbi:MAG: hypothetical protein IJ480_04350 [Clostridia bacterium]|nr:hypothetical protein [Clostridia bacterium]